MIEKDESKYGMFLTVSSSSTAALLDDFVSCLASVSTCMSICWISLFGNEIGSLSWLLRLEEMVLIEILKNISVVAPDTGSPRGLSFKRDQWDEKVGSKLNIEYCTLNGKHMLKIGINRKDLAEPTDHLAAPPECAEAIDAFHLNSTVQLFLLQLHNNSHTGRQLDGYCFDENDNNSQKTLVRATAEIQSLYNEAQ